MKMLNINRIAEKEKEYVLEVLQNEFRSSKGAEYMTRLESAFASTFKSKFAISHVNGTATMHSALEAAGIGQGDEVIVPPLTMASTSLAVIHANATPIFADVDPDTFLIDANDIERKITPKTKAIIIVSLYGVPPDFDAICKIAKTHNLILIEDNAQAFLSYYKGQLVGTFGDVSSFSFQSSKHIASGEGGIITTNDDKLAVGMRKMSGLGYASLGATKARITKADIQNPNYSRHDTLGWNYRMPELCCAVALAQVERISELVSARVESARVFTDAIDGFEWLVPQKVPADCISSYWGFACKLDTNVVAWADLYNAYVRNGGDSFYAAWKLTYKEPLFQQHAFGRRSEFLNVNYRNTSCPVAENLQPRIVAFKTNYWDFSEAEQQAEILRKTLAEF